MNEERKQREILLDDGIREWRLTLYYGINPRLINTKYSAMIAKAFSTNIELDKAVEKYLINRKKEGVKITEELSVRRTG